MGLFRRNKNTNKPIIRQILDLVPPWLFKSCTNTYKTDKGVSKYRTYDQFVALTFGQLNKCQGLSDISSDIGVSEIFIQDLGLSQSPARSTMSDGNKNRDWHVFESLYYRLLSHYKSVLKQHHNTHIIKEIKGKVVKLVDSSTISLCLSMFDWAEFRTAKGGIKLHTSWDYNLMIPDVVNITGAKVHDRYGLEQLIYPKDTIVVEDRAYFDFALMLNRIKAENVFVTRIKTNTLYKTVEELELPENIDQNILKDEIIQLTSAKAIETGISEHKLRLVHVYKEDENKVIAVITNQLDWEYNTIAELYKKRWDIELFFKALKQNLQVKTFWGTSENAVKSQIFVALINYLLLELIKRTISKISVAFSNLSEKIRFCLYHYLSLDYVCNQVREGVRKVKPPNQMKMTFEQNLFSG
ncbi:IS4 family transposase [Carboxylicivirga sp. M1479]|uniref:IS4 family transposase n=1 Tax=Carboxylicivirga sp. M1479 TaxID=2594476 RepID=UPI00117858EB|nr:IS4 family transposase [Carboxylicivirga sp. M1479]TRX71329.1 IS4 family transposase [Carboxylicivirga sp. M1479]